jgi:integrase/recombinase XerD
MEKANRREITVGAYLRVGYSDASGKLPVKLKVTGYRKTKMYPIQHAAENIRLTAGEWETITKRNSRPRGIVKDYFEAIEQAKAKAREAVKTSMRDGRPFTFEAFEKTYFSSAEGVTGFMGEFKRYLDKMLTEERIGTYTAYKTAYNIFNDFLGGKDISPYEVTVDLLKQFEGWLRTARKSGNKKNKYKAGATTVGIYARVLRIVFNLCADSDPALKQYYPFGSGRGKFKIGDTRKGGKKGDALTAEQVKKLISTFTVHGSPQWEAKQYWLFSFYCQGMNFRDIAFLRWENIAGKFIRYTRQKTKLTEAMEVQEIFITDSVQEILDALAKGNLRGDYVFPIIPQNENDLLRIEGIVRQKIKWVNRWLKSLCLANGLPPITTYWGRHSYASLLKQSGVSVEMIRELLGHSDLRTTEHYLKRFDVLERINVNKNLQNLVNASANRENAMRIMTPTL